MDDSDIVHQLDRGRLPALIPSHSIHSPQQTPVRAVYHLAFLNIFYCCRSLRRFGGCDWTVEINDAQKCSEQQMLVHIHPQRRSGRVQRATSRRSCSPQLVGQPRRCPRCVGSDAPKVRSQMTSTGRNITFLPSCPLDESGAFAYSETFPLRSPHGSSISLD